MSKCSILPPKTPLLALLDLHHPPCLPLLDLGTAQLPSVLANWHESKSTKSKLFAGWSRLFALLAS